MDFRKINLIFVIVFIGLNLFLFSIYREGQNEQEVVVRSNQTEGIESRLKNDNVTVAVKLSDEHREGYYLSAEQSDFSQAITTARKEQADTELFRTNTTISDNELIFYPQKSSYITTEKPDVTLEAFLGQKSLVLFGGDYQYAADLSNLDDEYPQIVGTQSFEGIPFNDASAQITINLETEKERLKVAKYVQTHLENIEPLREKMKLYSEAEVVNTLFINNKLPTNSKITKTLLAYSQTLEVREKNVFVPVWFVWIESSDKTVQIERVNALNNTIVTSNYLPKVENTE